MDTKNLPSCSTEKIHHRDKNDDVSNDNIFKKESIQTTSNQYVDNNPNSESGNDLNEISTNHDADLLKCFKACNIKTYHTYKKYGNGLYI